MEIGRLFLVLMQINSALGALIMVVPVGIVTDSCETVDPHPRPSSSMLQPAFLPTFLLHLPWSSHPLPFTSQTRVLCFHRAKACGG